MNQHFYIVEPFITLDNVAVRVYEKVMFQGTHWEIRGDEHWAVVGPNGSGKSTLMKALCGHAPVIQGSITYHFAQRIERNLTDMETKNPFPSVKSVENIAYVAFEAQSSVLGYEDPYYQMRWNSVKGRGTFTVSEYLSEQHIGRSNPFEVVETHRDPAAFAARREVVVAKVGIEALMDRNLVSISNGERRKVQIARALLQEPRLLVLDNPFTGLDQDFRVRLRALITDLMQNSMRVIVVATDMDDVPAGITHVLSVEDGAVVAQGPRGDLTDDRQPTTAVESTVGGQWSAVSGLDGNAVVEMRDVTITYDGVRVLDNVNWTVRQGERWALLGHNGAGKTTLLSLILGDNPQAYANGVALFGQRRGSGESIWDIKKRIGWVAPELHLYYPRQTTCFDVVSSGFFDAIGRYRRCTSVQRDVAKAWMQRLGIADYAETRFGALSEGEQRLVLLARALVKAPELLVLDEPCQGLDAHNRAQVIQTVEDIGRMRGITMIYVTHDVDELPGIITHVMRLSEGKVVIRDQFLDRF
jgi:molybdate transport system ATP-binding protein